MFRQQNQTYIARRLQRLGRHHQRIEQQLEGAFTFRLLIATVFFVALLGLALNLLTQLMVLATVLLGGVFIGGVVWSQRLKHHLRQIHLLEKFYDRVFKRVQLIPPPSKHLNFPVENALALDLDIFGSEGLLSMLDECLSNGGQKKLVEDLLNANFTEGEILLRQQQIAIFSKNAGRLRKYLRTSAPDFSEKAFGLDQLVKESLVTKNFSKIHRALWFGCLLTWTLALLDLFFQVHTPWKMLWVLYFFTTIYFLRKIEGAFTRLQDIILRFEALLPAFLIVEEFSKQPLLRKNLGMFSKNPTADLKRLRTGFAMLSVQSHPLFLFLINSIVPWNYFFVERAERVRAKLAHRFDFLFNEFIWFDMMIGLGFFHRYVTQDFAKVATSLRFKNARHPLIPLKQNVSNDFAWPENRNLILITGSNMAGKSTFLRTVGLNFILAKMGAPVLADEFHFPLVPLKTCIRVSDDLREGYSYFYAETLRVAEILKSAKTEKIFYLIDEVFKGTNNRERYLGGKTLVEKLSNTNSLGFITTHDLELSKIENHRMANFHFKDNIQGGEMCFTYKIENGPCPTTNALKIMRSAGIPVPE